MKIKYWALIHCDDKGHFGISFPDVPGCVSAGFSVEEAIEEGRKALRSNFNALEDAGMECPEARTLDVLLAEESFAHAREGALTVVQVSAAPKLGRSRRINISVDEYQLERIDEAAKRLGLTRSRLLVEGALNYG